MTFKEKLAMEHPECINERGMVNTAIAECPHYYGYENHSGKNGICIHKKIDCQECWNREIPNTNKKEEKSMDINPKPRKPNESPILLEGNYNLIIKGNEMVLVDNITGDIANARCHEDDEFYVCNGIDIAFTHLLEQKYGSNYRELQDAFNNVFRDEVC